MTEVDIVKKVCEIMGVEYSHYDNHKMGLDYFQFVKVTSIPKIILYSQKYGPWEFAILEDMTVVTDMSNSIKVLRSTYNKMLELGGELDDRTRQHINFLIEQETKIANAEKFLKENDCASVINNPDKKVNWV